MKRNFSINLFDRFQDGSYVRPHTSVDQSLQFFITRLYHDVVTIMRELNVDKVEITCLKAIFLFDPGRFNESNE